MKWFDGSIAEAVTLCKRRNSIFVVYVDGNDELSIKLRGFIEDDKIRSKLETDLFVAIRIDSTSESYMQFAQIYQLVPLPSIFFIGKNGTPIQIVTGIITNVDALEQKINAVLETVGIKESMTPSQLENGPTNTPVATTSTAASASQSFIANEQSNSDIVCEGEVCYRRPKKEEPVAEKSPSPSTDIDSNVAVKPPPDNLESSTCELDSQSPVASVPIIETITRSNDMTAKLEKAKQLIEEKRKEKEEEEKRLERDREMRRRQEGREMLNAQKLQKEQELQQLKENIRREKQEEQAARQRILEKIASDRAERAQKFSPAPTTVSTEKSAQELPTSETVQLSKPNVTNSSEFSRIQFRKPEGETSSHTFKSSELFQAVRDYVRTSILCDSGIRDFVLATTFPRREFTTIDDTKSLLDLGLCPSAVLLVIAGQRSANSPAAIVARSGGVVNMFNTIFWGLLTPFFAAFGYIRSFFTGRRPDRTITTGAQKRSNEENMADNDAAKRRNIDRLLNQQFVNDEPSTSNLDKSKKEGAYRRVTGSNIHRLRENKDSDDENNTWNGNSTQQQ